MNDQNPISNQVSLTPKPKVGDLVKDVFKKFYQNKKIFWLVVGLFVILVFITIVGLIFSITNGQVKKPVTVAPTPQTASISKIKSTDETEQALKALKERIFDLDIYQKRLTPPSVKFDIAF